MVLTRNLVVCVPPPIASRWRQRFGYDVDFNAAHVAFFRFGAPLLRCGLAILMGWLLFCIAVPAQGQVQTVVRVASEEQIKKSIERAQAKLLARLRNEADGPAALGVLALVKSGMHPSTPEIRQVCERVVKNASSAGSLNYNPGPNHIYEAAVTLLALSIVDEKSYKPQIYTIAKYLVDKQGKLGQWHYPHSDDGDTSITQYAMLGLWEASRCGYVVPLETWDRAAAWHLSTQQRDGGFAYHPQNLGGLATLHSMTAAGIGSLRIARRYLYPKSRQEHVVIDTPQPAKAPKKNRSGKRFGILEPTFREETPEEIGSAVIVDQSRVEQRNASYVRQVSLAQIDDGVNRAVTWMTTNFTVEKPTGYPIYFLYGLERASSLAEITKYGTRDWYSEGAAHLVSNQDLSGGWMETSGEYPATAFGILFLVRATSKMIEQEVPRVEFGTGILVGGRGLPDDLKASELADGKVKKDKKTPLEELLAQLENPEIPLLESTQAEIVEQVVIGDRNKLIGEIDRLKKLARHPDAEVRRTALWALGRSDDLKLAPILVNALKDPDIDVFVEARNALRCLSRQVEDFGLKEAPLDQASRDAEWQKWKRWYHAIRPYDERDDSITSGN